MTDAETIKPALTPDEWARGKVDANGFMLVNQVNDGCMAFHGFAKANKEVAPYLVNQRECFALAALALHGQPFGFTAEDVADLRWASRSLVHFGLRDLADRIAALLPPE